MIVVEAPVITIVVAAVVIAVGPVACRGTFRNWDYPIRRQIFAGFRTARDGAAQPTPPAGG